MGGLFCFKKEDAMATTLDRSRTSHLRGLRCRACRALQPADERSEALCTLSYGGCQRTIKLAVKKELAVLGIEADDVGRQHIDGEIRRELRDVLAVMKRRTVPAIVFHEVGTRASAFAAPAPHLPRKPCSPQAAQCRRRARALRGRDPVLLESLAGGLATLRGLRSHPRSAAVHPRRVWPGRA